MQQPEKIREVVFVFHFFAAFFNTLKHLHAIAFCPFKTLLNHFSTLQNTYMVTHLVHLKFPGKKSPYSAIFINKGN
jgi:hypothetical protein